MMAWQIYLPLISPWVDLRPFKGSSLTSSSATFASGVGFVRSIPWLCETGIWTYPSTASRNLTYTPEQTISTYSGKNVYLIGRNTSGSNNTALTELNTMYGLDRVSATIGGTSGYHWFATEESCILLPSRPLEKDPEETDECLANVTTSLSGVSYRTSYSHKRTWKISLLLDGPIDSDRSDYFADSRRQQLELFFKRAEHGVTVHLQGRNSSLLDTSYRFLAPYIGVRNSISGQLNGGSWTIAGQDDKARRYKLELQIDEVKDPTNRYE